MFLVFALHSAFAHRLDEYLQATLVAIESDHLQISLRLIPGVAVAETTIADLDSDYDGKFSEAEQEAYVAKIGANLLLHVNDQKLEARLSEKSFPSLEQIRAGFGEIKLSFRVDLPRGLPSQRRVTIEQLKIHAKSVYLVNALAPTDSHIQIDSQSRNDSQSFYELKYTQLDSVAGFSHLEDATGFMRFFRLGLEHIAGGTDHLMFLFVLLLVAPLNALKRRWSSAKTLRQSWLHIVQIVTAFSIGHSITLALSALSVVHVPSAPIEVLIAISILISAVHALRPFFPGREALVALGFGLVHGLAFASTLNELGLAAWDRVVGLVGFNFGIEVMQLILILLTIPPLVWFATTRCYVYLRIGGGVVGIAASLFWICDRI